MSNGASAALALALGAGGGFLVWRLAKKGKKPGGGAAPAAKAAWLASPMPATSTSVPPPTTEPPRAAWPCSLKLDAKGLTANGERVDVTTAVARCKQAGRAELAVTGDAPAGVHAQLAAGLWNAQVPMTTRAA